MHDQDMEMLNSMTGAWKSYKSYKHVSEYMRIPSP